MGHAYQSQLRRWDVIAELCKEIGARTFVEVGCKEGRVTGFVLENLPNIRAVAIDPWQPQPESNDPLKETYRDWDFSAIEAEFKRNIGANADRCEMWRLPSIAAYGITEPADVIFIDASHDYESVKQDIGDWWPKVKPGGFLVLHDYNHKWPGVMRAVADCFSLMDVNVAPDSVAYIKKGSVQ